VQRKCFCYVLADSYRFVSSQESAMSDLVFYTNPQSRGQTVRWLLEEMGVAYEQRLLDYDTSMKADDYLAINPMGKVPAIVHRGRIVTESAAICLYLADAFPEAGLLPALEDRADYYRWIFFVAGPVEAAFSNKAAGFAPKADQERMFGYGNYERTIDALEQSVTGKSYIAGDRFSAADVYVGAMMDFMLMFNLLDPRPAFTSYVEGLRERPAYKRAKEIDAKLVEATQQPA
jgi:glutathione S-transferase